MTQPPPSEHPLQLPADLITDPDGVRGVRFGVGGARMVDVTGLTRAEAEAVSRLGALTHAQWSTAHTTRPVGQRWPQVVQALEVATREVTADDPTGQQVVALDGGGRLPDAVGEVLPVGIATVRDPWQIAALASSTSTAPDLVVLFGSRAVAPHRYRPWQRLGVPHLPVVVGPRRLHLGPVAGTGEVCLRCVDLRRTDRDPAWPQIVAAASAADPGNLPDVLPADLLAIGSGAAALIIRAVLAPTGFPAGLSVSVSDAGPWLLYHHWPRHPACGCAAPPLVEPASTQLREAG
ncbi:hypothetical protein ATK17_0433 [Branchiibius hedensis]|uniref:Bacteriocin biosynthesis cyclodehydratase domain-containing protein n=1 Tax=Branchiibius hedensis TaxID=672460 RepID=A0A2Y8ZL64_9MICO|nr:hypothetical protein [Branchiibius hedensis]PWJ24344.1 hypothetical protein ATK17_0433 [Branchiibius hedensis]SSA33161.1 hypothetical protein SAMN04489750_0433 [Branchiibius hedensis]